MKIMLVGPMTGIDGFNFSAFNEVAKALRAQGHKVYNPAELKDIDNRVDLPQHIYLRRSVSQMCLCDAVCTLPEWEDSPGACIEIEVAHRVNLPVVEWNELSEREDLKVTIFRPYNGKIKNGENVSWIAYPGRVRKELHGVVVAFVKKYSDLFQIFPLLRDIQAIRRPFKRLSSRDRYLVSCKDRWYAPQSHTLERNNQDKIHEERDEA